MSDRYLLVLWLTGRCNLNCTYCYAEGSPSGADMTFETARAAIDRLQPHPLKIQFAGGEPLMNFPLAEKICQYVREQGIDGVFQMQTNGTLLDLETARRLKELGISVGISLDGPPEINELTRGQTLRAVEGIRNLGRVGTVIGLNAVVTAKNVESLPRLVDFALYLGNVGGIGLDLLRHAGRGEEGEQDASPEQLARAMEAMYLRSRELEKLTRRRIQIREIEQAKRRLRTGTPGRDYCYASCGRSVVVTPDGSLFPCGSLKEQSFAMGRAETLTAEAILAITAPAEAQCGSCPYGRVCPKGCPSRRIRNENNLDCVMLKTAFQLAERELYENKH